MNELIAYLTAIKGYAKNIHYTVHGDCFYSGHVFVDRIEEPIAEYIDSIKEICLLGHLPEGERPLETSKYDEMAKGLYPKLSETDDEANFKNLQDLIVSALTHINTFGKLSRGEENLIGAIAEHLQKYNGLLNLKNFKE